jgi:hypothetical protein
MTGGIIAKTQHLRFACSCTFVLNTSGSATVEKAMLEVLKHVSSNEVTVILIKFWLQLEFIDKLICNIRSAVSKLLHADGLT